MAIEVDPNYALAYNNWGAALANQKKYEEAIEKFKKAIEVDPKQALAYNNWGFALAHQKKYEEAIEKFKKAIEVKPDYADAYNNWGNALRYQKKYDEAIEKFKKAIEVKPDYADAYNNWGLALVHQKKYEEAIERYKKAIEVKPNYADVYNNWGLALADQKKYEEAIEKFKKAIEIDPEYALAYNNWGAALADQKKYEEAIEKFKKAIEVDPKQALAYNNWGAALADQKKYEEAIEKYKKAIEIDPNHALAYNNWGYDLAAQKKYEEAIENYKKAVEIDPDYADAYFNWGLALSDQKKYEEAIEKFKKAIQADEDYVYAYHNIAYFLGRQGKYQEGWEAWEKARRVYERTKKKAKAINNADHFYYYGWVLYDVFGELNEAEEIYKEGLTLDPNHTGILTGLVNLYLEQKDEDVRERTNVYWKARENYRKAERLLNDQRQKEDDASTLLQLGELLLKMEEHTEAEEEKYSEAEKYFMRALEKNRESATPYADLGVLYTFREDFKRGAQYFEDALKRDPDELTIWSNLAEAYLRSNLKEKAEAEYKRILRITSEHIESQIGLGEVYTAMGDDGDRDMYEQAIRHFTDGINMAESKKGSKRMKKKELAAAYYSRGYASVKLYEISKVIGDERLLHDALGDFEECFRLDPDYHKAGRAIEKLKKRLSRFSLQRLMEKLGPPLISVSSLFVFILSQCSFFFGKPNISIEVGYYALLTFGSLIFTVAGLSLPQILKLKVAGIELEKSSVEQITTPGPIGISK
ncbi:tetratricopeptide repeat protein [Candidatus Poribacteria bacterium]|nr:tetratricopeptide repeat protein [Candidatus Poribacteria bacterium]